MSQNEKKRHLSTPQGATSKNTRMDDNNTDEIPTSNQFAILNDAISYADITMRRQSISSHGSRGGSRGGDGPTRAANMGEKSFFVTAKPDKGLRDDVIIECQTINGNPFKGTITFKEAKLTIFEGKLGYDRSLLHSIRTSFNGCPVIKFKLNQQIDIDDLVGIEHFNFNRSYPVGKETRTDIIQCRILGIRSMQSVTHSDSPGSDVRWVKIEGCEYTLEDQQIIDWLKLYGDPISSICEDIHEDSDSDGEPIGNGTYSVKMKLIKDIPQFLPMYGRRIRIYYKGITKLCTKCFGTHARRQCGKEKVPWINYVRDYMKNNESIEENYYGKWWDIIDKEFPGYFDDHEPDANILPKKPTGSVQSEEIKDSNPQLEIQSNQPLIRQSRDPRLNRKLQPGQVLQHQQPAPTHQPNEVADTQDREELSYLMAKGLTLADAKSYQKSKMDQQHIERKMRSFQSNGESRSSSTNRRGAPRGGARGSKN